MDREEKSKDQKAKTSKKETGDENKKILFSLLKDNSMTVDPSLLRTSGCT